MLKNKKGFNLVELTVTTLIMAILAAIALPYYRSAVERSKIVTNLSVLKALQDAVVQYYPQDNEFPTRLSQLHVGVPRSNDSGNDGGWVYSGLQVRKEKRGEVYTIVLDTVQRRISLECFQAGSSDYRIDFHFVINASGLAPAAKTFTVTSGNPGRIRALNRAAASAGWRNTAPNVYSLD
ncbi:MAG: prepilin-type N-terminal cleavage/methylation domain-containing protein [Elusimicrobiota bacterium]|jgi:prepilin-type N-terminal cleavage/methylation domain-containing protein|nr:prepilin-type N-terminal cleavage/methylation domain-containing protein [Elusimicrobiota bacterium]